MDAREIEKIILKSVDLPTMPHVAAKTMQLLSDPNVSSKDLQKVISSDSVLAANILKISNSALYGCSREILPEETSEIRYEGLCIIENKGQIDSDMGDFYIPGYPLTVSFDSEGINYYLQSESDKDRPSLTVFKSYFSLAHLVKPIGIGPIEGRYNYFIGDSPDS